MEEAMRFVLEVSATWLVLSFIGLAFMTRRKPKKHKTTGPILVSCGGKTIVVSGGR